MSFDCQPCGACCAYAEAWPTFIGDRDCANIPDELIDFEHGRMLCHANRCAALVGRVGVETRCSIYADRPLVCREFQAGSDDCIMVRRSFSLPAA